VKEFLAPHLVSPENTTLKTAREALAGRNPEAVRKALEPLEEKDDECWILLAQAWLSIDPGRVKECTDRIAPGSKWSSAAEGLQLLAVAIQSAGTIPESPSRDAYAAGMEAARKLDWDDALERWLGVMRDDPKFANGSAAEAIKAVFRVLGPRHPSVEKHHRTFSSLLYC
jgi:putative thioredoxin